MGAGGRIVFISSSSSQAGQKGRSAYSASKAGMNAFAQALVFLDTLNPRVVIGEIAMRAAAAGHYWQTP
jgi:NAD(P)-dependent dehydrogenase (short-subunit alcohol dehydrogenase family)